MKASTHLVSRMSQRAIGRAELDIVMAFGEVDGDKVIVNKQRARDVNPQNPYNMYIAQIST